MTPIPLLKRLSLAAFAFLTFMHLLTPSSSAQIIQTNFTATNVIHFKLTNYFAAENSIQALISVVRDGTLTNGDTVSVDYTMIDGTAVSGVDYYKTTGTITFFPGVQQVQFTVPLIDNFIADGNRFLTLILRNPGNGANTLAVLGTPDTATLTILDDESAPASSEAGYVEIAPGNSGSNWKFFFQSEVYTGSIEEWNVDKNNNANFTPYGPAGIQFTVVRKGGSRGKILVDWETTTNVVPLFDPIFFIDPFFGTFGFGGGLAVPFDDFIPTNGTVALNDFQMSTNVLIRLPSTFNPEFAGAFGLDTNLYLPPKTFGVELTGVRAAPEEAGQNLNPTLGTAILRNVALVDCSRGFAFTRQHYYVSEGQKYCLVRVRRSLVPPPPGSTSSTDPFGAVHVHYAINPRLIITDHHGGDYQGNIFSLEPGSDYSTPFIDYSPPGSPQWTSILTADPGAPAVQHIDEATLDWGTDDVTDRFIVVPLFDDKGAEFNEDLEVVLYKDPGEDFSSGYVNLYSGVCTIKILDNDTPAGASESPFNPDNDKLTDPPYITTPGANNTVQSVAVQPDGKVVIGGDFSSYNTFNRSGIARLNFDGQIDHSFDPGTGVAGFVRAVALQADGKILVGGGFDAVNGIPRFSIARLLTNGVVDATFNPGIGADGPVRAICVQPDGKILIGGEFLSYDGTNRTYIARLNADGRLDTSFDPGAGPSAPVNSIAVTAGALDVNHSAAGGPAEDRFLVDTGSSQGTITINYDFLQVPDDMRVYYDGQVIFDTGLVSGAATITVPYGPGTSTSVEIVMNEGSGLAGTIWTYDMQIQPFVDDRIVIGGEFTDYNGTSINFVARLNQDGSLDSSFDPGSAADDVVYAVAKQGNKVFLAGDFKTVDLRPRHGIARLNEDGSLDLSFDPGVGFDNTAYALEVQHDGKPLLGGTFTSFNYTRRIGLARLNMDGSLDTTYMDTAKNQFAGLINPLSPDNVESQENFVRSIGSYRFTNLTTITNLVVDTNGVTNAVIVTNIDTSDHNFIGGRFQQIGSAPGRSVIRPRLNLARIRGGETPGPGNIAFSDDVYNVDENAGFKFITTVRTNGSLAPVSARFDAGDLPVAGPGSATGGQDYIPISHTNLWVRTHDGDRQYSDASMGPSNYAFSTNRERGDFTIYPPFSAPPRHAFGEDKVSDRSFVTILDDNVAEGDEVVDLTLSSPDMGRLLLGGEPIPVGTALGKAKAKLVIVDNDFNFGTLGFSAPEYIVNENGTNAIITVTREGGSSGTVTVDLFTQDGTASSTGGTPDYVPVTRQTLTFANGQNSRTLAIRIKNDTQAELEETVKLFLTNPTGFPTNVPPNLRLDPARSAATLTIIDEDSLSGRLSFDQTTYSVAENAGAVTVTVLRRGGTAGELFVNYATADGAGAGGAKAGIDYQPTSGVLHWVDGESTPKIFTVGIIDNNVVDPDRSFNVVISNPSLPDTLGARPTAEVRILNDDAFGGFVFSQSLYNVDENGAYADVTVLRLNGGAGSVDVNFAATNLTAIGTNLLVASAPSGIPDFVLTNGTLHFGPGEASKTFRVYVIDDPIVEGDKQVQLTLSNPVNASIISSNAVLTILDNELARTPAGLIDTTFQSQGADDFVYSLELQKDDGKILLGGDFHSLNGIPRNRLGRLNPDGTLDASFDTANGPNDTVRAIEQQPDGRILIAGLFSGIGPTNRNHLARLNINSTVDPTFNPGAGTDNPIYALAQQPDGRIVIVGDFGAYRGISRKGIARVFAIGNLIPLGSYYNTSGQFKFPVTLGRTYDWAKGTNDVSFQNGTDTINPVAGQPVRFIAQTNYIVINGVGGLNVSAVLSLPGSNGDLDTSFDPGTGANDTVWTVALQPDGKILIGGDFTAFNGVPQNRIARLNPNGSVDTTFGPGLSEADDSVRAILVQSDGKILIGGFFTSVNGQNFNRLARLNPDGSLDSAFNIGAGANGIISALALQIDGKILVGGNFSQFNGRTRNCITRLNSDGTLDPTINFGSGANATVTAILVQPDRKIVLAGGFTEYDGQPAPHVVRIHGGSIAGQGKIQFTKAYFVALENSTNALITIRRTGGTTGDIAVNFATVDGTATPGLDYTPVSGKLIFPEAESFQTVLIPLKDDALVEDDETVSLQLTDLPGGNFLGAQPNATLTLISDDSLIEFTSPSYNISENFVTGSAVITLRRTGYTGVPNSVTFSTQDGTATAGQDYAPVNSVVTFAAGEKSRTFIIPIFDDKIVEGNETVLLHLSNVTGKALLGLADSVLTIIDDDFAPGELSFTSDTFSGLEASGKIVVSVKRTSGSSGVVSATYSTRRGTATPLVDYDDVTGIVSFGDGETLKSFVIPVHDDDIAEGNEDLFVTLSNPQGGAAIVGNPTARAVIVDDDLGPGSVDDNFKVGTGANAPVRALKIETDGGILIGGEFTSFNGTSRNHLARLVSDGSVDPSFDPGTGPNNTVVDIEPDSADRLLIAGSFNTVDGVIHNRVARILDNAQLDPTFNLPLGLNAEVSDVVRQPDGKVLIGGMFEKASAAGRNHIVRLNADGTVDLSFDPGTGADNNVHAIAVQPDGKILVGGAFAGFNGSAHRYLVRLNPDGSIDGTGFNVGIGANGPVRDILLLADGSILIAGDFTSYNNTPRVRVARLKADGTVDASFNPGAGPDAMVLSLATQPDGKIFIAGDFLTFAAAPRQRIARLNTDGTLDAKFNPGDGANAIVYRVAVQPIDGKVLIAGAFTTVDRQPSAGVARFNNDKSFITMQPIQLNGITRANGGNSVQFEIATQPGFTYAVEASSDLNSWSTVRTITATTTTTEFNEQLSARYRFYRVRRVAP